VLLQFISAEKCYSAEFKTKHQLLLERYGKGPVSGENAQIGVVTLLH
jgi:hypothetical protein